MQHLAIAQDYSLLLIRTDRFKHINDLYGHSKGDGVMLTRPQVALAKAIWCFVGEAKSLSYCYRRLTLDTALSLWKLSA